MSSLNKSYLCQCGYYAISPICTKCGRSTLMKFVRGKESQIINIEFVRVIDIHEMKGKFEVQADMGEYSIVLADFEHLQHATLFIDNLWSKINT